MGLLLIGELSITFPDPIASAPGLAVPIPVEERVPCDHQRVLGSGGHHPILHKLLRFTATITQHGVCFRASCHEAVHKLRNTKGLVQSTNKFNIIDCNSRNPPYTSDLERATGWGRLGVWSLVDVTSNDLPIRVQTS